MYYVVIALDRPDTQQLRERTRAAHLEYLHGQHDGVELRLAGPLFAEDERTMVGSLIVVRAATREAVARFSAHDPFHQAQLFSEVTIRAWNWRAGNPDEA